MLFLPHNSRFFEKSARDGWRDHRAGEPGRRGGGHRPASTRNVLQKTKVNKHGAVPALRSSIPAGDIIP